MLTAMFSGVSGIGSGIVFVTGRPRGFGTLVSLVIGVSPIKSGYALTERELESWFISQPLPGHVARHSLHLVDGIGGAIVVATGEFTNVAA